MRRRMYYFLVQIKASLTICGDRIWCMKFCILAVYARIVDKLPHYKTYIKYIWASLFLTWVAVVVVTLFECRPFNQ